ncbi:MAG TPA: universal stress protein [Ktedonobacteraceae bacterium]
MFARILVPLDGSAAAEEALPVAARIARASRGSMHLLRVVKSPIDLGEENDFDPLLSEQELESGTTVASDYLRTVAASPLLDGIQVTTETAPGLAPQYILAAARSGEFDLTVLSSHGRTGFTRWVLGSVAHTLAHESTVPTLVLREHDTAALLAHPDAIRPLRTLVPLDGSPLAEAALAPAAHLVAGLTTQGELHLIHVVRPLQNPAEEGVENPLNAKATARARTYLTQVAEHWQAMARELGISLSCSVAFGTDVAGGLLSQTEPGAQGQATADSRGCDLIAISTHGRHGLERWVMGSVTDRLLNTTKLPLLIVRPQT